MMMRAQTVFLALAALLWGGGVASAQQIGTCDTNGCVIDMSPPIYVLNNEWGNNNDGWGTITVDGPTSWSTSWDFAPRSDWAVISWPAAVLGWQWGYRLPNTGLPVQLASRTPINTSAAFNVVPDPSCAPGGVGGGGTGSRVCRLDVAYDMWFHDTSSPGTSSPVYELMIWLAYSRELFSGTPANAYATLGGHEWKVIRTQGGSSPVATFLINEPADLTGATLNITDFTDWLVTNGWIPATWWIDSVQFGTEIFKGKGTLSVPCYTAAVGVPTTDCGQTPPPPPPPPGPTPTVGPVSINAGGGAVDPFVADADVSGGTAATNWTGAINTSGVTNPAPQAIYQSERYGAMTYTIAGLVPATLYTVRLHFAENYFTRVRQRVFNVAINGTTALGNFDIFAAARKAHKAVVREFTVAANASGEIVIAFTNGTNNALINGIQVLQ
jgi:hypothetical protein